MTKAIEVNIFVGDKIKSATINFSKKIESITFHNIPDTSLPLLMPGFIDLHSHGSGGKDIMEGGNAIEVIGKTHAKFGTTSFLATTMTAPFKELEHAFLSMKEYYEHRPKNSAECLGVHLEGPFISSEKLGAQPNFTREATLDEIRKLHRIVPIRVITLAPESHSHLELIKSLSDMNIIVQVGHSNGTYEEGVDAIASGAKSFTHLYNAMSGLHHRKPGIVGAALLHAEYSEIIPDLEHVHPAAILLAHKCIPQLYFVTDSTSATGMPDGEYKLGTHIVHKCLNGVKLSDGTLAGSSLTMDQAFRNLIKIGLPPHIISEKLSTTQTKLLEIKDRGYIKVGFKSDFILMNEKFKILEVFIDGEKCDN
jgi:N-acetylglucosamine-6-phosphate deacetylase